MRKLWVKAWTTLDGVFDAETMDCWWQNSNSPERMRYIMEQYATGDAYLVSVDARTGKPDAAFGEGGRVDTMRTIRDAIRGTNCREQVVGIRKISGWTSRR